MKRLFKDTLIYGSGRYIQQVVGFLLIPVYTRCLQPADYGIMDTISVFQATLGILFVLGLDSAFARFYMDTHDIQEKRRITSTVLLFRIAVVGIFACFTFVASERLAVWFYKDAVYAPVFRVVSVLFIGNLLYSFSLEALRFNLLPVRYAVTSVTVTLSTILLTVYFIVYLRIGVIGIFLAQAIVLLAVGFPLAFWRIRHTVGLIFSVKLLRELLAFGLPLVPAAVSYFVMTHSNRYFMLKFITLDAVGLYAVGEKFVRILVLITAGFQLAWGPFAFSIYKQEGAREVFSRILTAYTAIMCTVAVGVSIFAQEIVKLMTQPDYFAAADVIPFLIFSPVAMGMYYIVAVGVNIKKKTKHIGWTTMVAAGVNVLLCFMLIPRWGIRAAALSTTVSYAVSTGCLLVVAQKVYPIPYDFFKVGVTVIISGCATVMSGLIPRTGFLPGIVYKSGILAGMAGLFLVFKIFQPRVLLNGLNVFRKETT